MGDLLASARQYARAGWPVFPCRPGAKTPAIPYPHPKGEPCRGGCGRDGHGVLDATTDPHKIETWWSRWPTANIGIATGAPGPDVVDVDVAAGKPGAASLARVRNAGLVAGAIATVRTWSGGLHIYFQGTDQGNSALARHGIDFRGLGGYVVAPPSEVEGRPYQLVARRAPTGVTVDWSAIRRLLDPPRPHQARSPGRPGDHSALVRWVAGLQPGGRNEGLFWAACRAVEAGAGDAVLDELATAAVSAGLSPAEAERTVRSAQRVRADR